MTNTNAKRNATENRFLSEWVDESVRLTRPDQVYWCDGTEAERERLTSRRSRAAFSSRSTEASGPAATCIARNPNDVARTEDAHLRLHAHPRGSGPDQQLDGPRRDLRKLGHWLEGSMRGRTMYVVPYVMGPLGSPFANVGVELTDSIYVALNMRIMTRMGRAALDDARRRPTTSIADFIARSTSIPNAGLICHFPQDNTIWSVGSGYGGNALLSKKCFALRIASWLGQTRRLACRAHADPGLAESARRRPPTSRRPFRAPAARPIWRC